MQGTLHLMRLALTPKDNNALHFSFASMSFPGPNKDKYVRATDLDALSCRLSASRKGYFRSPDVYIPELVALYKLYLQYCEGYTQMSAGRAVRETLNEPKFPLINRGTYFRTESINRIVALFIAEHGRCQVVALGGGSDTRCFRVLEQYASDGTVDSYTEIDFAQLTRIKKIAISKSPKLKRIVGADASKLAPIDVSSKEEMARIDPDLHCEKYHLVSFDLRKCASEGREKFAFLKNDLPTLVLSECVLCYLTPEQNISVLEFWKSCFSRVAVILYDPMGLDDAFGKTMAQNLSRRGLDMLTFTKYPDLAARKHLFEETLGFSAFLTDLALVGGYGSHQDSWIADEDLARVSRLEMIDEVEEIALLLKHYCLIYAESGMLLKFPTHLQWLLE